MQNFILINNDAFILILTAGGCKEPFFLKKKAEITPGWLKLIILLKIQNASQNISADIFVFSGFP
jgi:hypothetical protein